MGTSVIIGSVVVVVADLALTCVEYAVGCVVVVVVVVGCVVVIVVFCWAASAGVTVGCVDENIFESCVKSEVVGGSG